MRNKRAYYLVIITILLAMYYLYGAVYLQKLGYFSRESLFYSEKARIVLEGRGNRLKVMGLTSPIIPFYATFLFSWISYLNAPIIASAIAMSALYYLMATTMIKRLPDDFYLWVLTLTFMFHPGILYAAHSGGPTAMTLIFFFMFFFNIIKFYHSNTTFHVSISSICMVILVFCNYKFIWLTLFFIPLVLSIVIHSLNLAEKESIFRLFLSFNNPTLRRKLVNKTFAMYIIIFILPITSVIIYKLLNLTHANDMNYFIESPYANSHVLTDAVNYDLSSNPVNFKEHPSSFLGTLSIFAFCPMLILAIYLFRKHTYQVLTVLTPLALIMFLQVKYDKTYLSYEFFLIFLILSLLCLFFRGYTVKRQWILKTVVGVLALLQIYTGYVFLKNSRVDDEQNYVRVLKNRQPDDSEDEDKEVANFIDELPAGQQVLIDDAVAYPIVGFVKNFQSLTLPYQETFLGAVEMPSQVVDYIVVTSDNNDTRGLTQLSNRYLSNALGNDIHFNIRKVYQTDNWAIYKIF